MIRFFATCALDLHVAVGCFSGCRAFMAKISRTQDIPKTPNLGTASLGAWILESTAGVMG